VQFIWNHLEALAHELWQAYGCTLWVQHGYPMAVWGKWLQQHPGSHIFAGHDYEPSALARDEQVAALAATHGGQFRAVKEHLVFHLGEVLNQQGKPYTVYTPYSKAWKARLLGNASPEAGFGAGALASFYLKPYPTLRYLPTHLNAGAQPPQLPSLAQLGFLPVQANYPPPTLSPQTLDGYAAQRDYPALPTGTSRLSVHLRFGTVGIRALVRQALERGTPGSEKYLNELIWREFYSHVLQHFPHTATENFRPEFNRIRWLNRQEDFDRWCAGETGYPLVDAGMRELNATGHIHNRARMVVASFLTKHLLCHWQMGEAYFAEKLLDYDLAQNVGGWQWAAGTGTDAAPYFRIFNPTMQAQKFDPQGVYIRKWVPEVGTARYARPMVDHATARARCLAAYAPE
jgi:deoxyribodipyrimidine photo-lyase